MNTYHRHTQRARVLELGEDEAGRGVVAGHEEEHDGDGEHTEHVPPRAHVGEEGDDPHPEAVQDAVHDEDGGVHDQDVARRGLVPLGEVQEHGEEGGEAEVDAGGDGDLAEQVEPTGEPAPGARVVLRQLGRPVVEAAGGRVGRGDLRHAQADDGGHDPDDDPAPHDVDGPAVGHAEVVERQAAGQDRDDGEGHGEVGESAHSPAKLLGIAECVQLGQVGVTGRVAQRSIRNGGHQIPLAVEAGRLADRCASVQRTWQQGSTAVSSKSSFRFPVWGMSRRGGQHGRGISVERNPSRTVRGGPQRGPPGQAIDGKVAHGGPGILGGLLLRRHARGGPVGSRSWPWSGGRGSPRWSLRPSTRRPRCRGSVDPTSVPELRSRGRPTGSAPAPAL